MRMWMEIFGNILMLNLQLLHPCLTSIGSRQALFSHSSVSRFATSTPFHPFTILFTSTADLEIETRCCTLNVCRPLRINIPPNFGGNFANLHHLLQIEHPNIYSNPFRRTLSNPFINSEICRGGSTSIRYLTRHSAAQLLRRLNASCLYGIWATDDTIFFSLISLLPNHWFTKPSDPIGALYLIKRLVDRNLACEAWVGEFVALINHWNRYVYVAFLPL